MARRNAYYDGITPRSLAGSAGGGASAPIYSMYRPEAEAQLTAAVAGRQQRFDVATQGVAQELARIGDIETYDRDALEGRIGSFTGKVNKLVQDKYGGDYSAAANELALMVGRERGDPFYAFNKQKVEAVKNYQQDKRRLGANFIGIGDPTQVSQQEWQEGETFEYTPVNKQDIVAASASMFKNMSVAIREGAVGEWQSTAGRKLLERMVQRGFGSPEEVEEFLQEPEGRLMVEELMNSMPELAGATNQQAVTDAIRQGAYSGIGRTEISTVANPAYGAPTGGGDAMTARRVIVAPEDLADMTKPYFAPLADAMAREKGYESMAHLQKQVNRNLGARLLESTAAFGQEVTDPSLQSLRPGQAKTDLEDIQGIFSQTVKDQGLVMEDINKIGRAGSKSNTAINNISKQIDTEYDDTASEWTAIDSRYEKQLKKITKNRTIKGMNLHPMLGMTLLVEGKTEDGESMEAIVSTDNNLLVLDFIDYYSQLDENKLTDMHNWLDWMSKNNPQAYEDLTDIRTKEQ